MLVGYARTSTVEQHAGLEAQVRDLSAAGCDKVFEERVSSVAHRAELAAALDYVREGDTLIVMQTGPAGAQHSGPPRHRGAPERQAGRLGGAVHGRAARGHRDCHGQAHAHDAGRRGGVRA